VNCGVGFPKFEVGMRMNRKAGEVLNMKSIADQTSQS